MRRRTAITLTEVLVSLFIMAIGLMALLTLFPLGALSMAQAIKDGRSQQVAQNALGIAQAFNLRHENRFYLLNGNVETGSPAELVNSYTNPNELRSPLVDISNATNLSSQGNRYQGPSYPVYVDPIGMKAFNGSMLGGVIPRRYCNAVYKTTVSGTTTVTQLNNGNITTWFTVLDDMNFSDNGTPSQLSNTIQRQGLYSWAYLLKRPRARDWNVANLWVVVYKGRGLQLTNGGLTPLEEQVIPGVRARDSKTLTVTSATPPVRRGGWILDITQERDEISRMRYGPIHGIFYRVVAVTRTGTSYQLELQTPLRTGTSIDTILVMDNVVEVIEKGDGWMQ
jgi:hypothetical protein